MDTIIIEKLNYDVPLITFNYFPLGNGQVEV